MAVTQERPKWEPAIVQGNQRRAVATFIEDSRGDLVDIEYRCLIGCASTEDRERSLPWPGYSWPADYSVHCTECHEPINTIEEG